MKHGNWKTITLFLGVPWLCLATGASDIPKNVSKEVQKKIQEVEPLLKKFDCLFLAHIYHPKNAKIEQLGFCFYSLTESRGIFSSTACVGVMAEPFTQTRNAFYSNKGHWGILDKCDAQRLRKKLQEPEIHTTVNPISSIAIKRKEGFNIRLIRDDFGLWDEFDKQTVPKPTQKNKTELAK